MHHRRILFLALAAAGAATSAEGATRVWPNPTGVGGCAGLTLQGCIDGAAPGDTVVIAGDDLLFPDRYTTVDETVTIAKSLTLRASAGIDAVFSPGRGVRVDLPPGVATDVAIESVTLRRGSIDVNHRSDQPSSVRVERVRVLDTDASCAVQFLGDGSARGTFSVIDSAIAVRARTGPAVNGLCAAQNGPSWSVAYVRNRIVADPGSMLTTLGANGTGAGTVTISGNQVLGESFVTGVGLSQNRPGRWTVQIDGNAIAGQRASPATSAAGLLAQLRDAEIAIVNNTIVDGAKGITILSEPPGAITGRVANNIVAFQSSEGYVLSTAPALTNRDNLDFANASNAWTPGPGTIASNPLLRSLRDPRLTDASPAINAGDNASLPPLSFVDADGEPRIALATVDLGAYETNGDLTAVHVASAANTFGNYTIFERLEGTDLTPNALPVATAHRVAGVATVAENFGAWLADPALPSDWSIYHEDAVSVVPFGQRYSVMAPLAGRTAYAHDTTLANVVGEYTTLSHPELDGRPNAIAVVTHAFRDGTGLDAYEDHPYTLEYFGGRWNVRADDAAAMSARRRFHVVIAPQLGANAFRAVNAAGAAVGELRLEHPLLDDNPCAAPIVGRVDPPGAPLTRNPSPFAVEYRAGSEGAAGRWFVVPLVDAIAADAGYHVIVDGAQASGCRNALLPGGDTLFSNGFE